MCLLAGDKIMSFFLVFCFIMHNIPSYWLELVLPFVF